MEDIKRRSPVSFPVRPKRTEVRDQWTVALEYDGEKDGPHLVDLSHREKWDLQDKNVSDMEAFGVKVPQTYGQCAYQDGLVLNRMNRTQTAIWNLGADPLTPPDHPGFTPTTDTFMCLAVLGKPVFAILEKLSALDFAKPGAIAPFLVQGPVSHVPCQVVVANNGPDNPGVVFTCSRGYAKDMVNAVLEAGEEFGLKPAGEAAFHAWLANAMG